MLASINCHSGLLVLLLLVLERPNQVHDAVLLLGQGLPQQRHFRHGLQVTRAGADSSIKGREGT